MRKQKKVRQEMLFGTVLMLLFLPVILVAGLWGIIAAGFSGLFAIFSGQNPVVYLPELLVYGALLAALIVFAYKYISRYAQLIRRMIRIRQEKRRIRRLGVLEPNRTDDLDDMEPDESQSLRAFQQKTPR